jgi:hypothetical protein
LEPRFVGVLPGDLVFLYEVHPIVSDKQRSDIPPSSPGLSHRFVLQSSQTGPTVLLDDCQNKSAVGKGRKDHELWNTVRRENNNTRKKTVTSTQ